MENFIIAKSNEFLGEFVVSPSAKLLLSLVNFDTSAEPIYNLFNYSLPDLYKYVINSFNAKVRVKPEFPFFIITFTTLQDASNFAEELNKRCKRNE